MAVIVLVAIALMNWSPSFRSWVAGVSDWGWSSDHGSQPPIPTPAVPAPQTTTTPEAPAGSGQPVPTAPTQAGTPSQVSLGQLASLAVIPARPSPGGYERSCEKGKACSFGQAWDDNTNAPGGHNGCDTRNDLLRSQMTDVTYKSGNCVVASGTYNDPYTGRTVHWTKADASSLQVDHIVPLSLAWDLGASNWTAQQRAIYANDEETVLLLADGKSNSAKGDEGPSQWMPPNKAYACTYDAKFVAVLAKYSLPVTQADKAAIAKTLSAC